MRNASAILERMVPTTTAQRVKLQGRRSNSATTLVVLAMVAIGGTCLYEGAIRQQRVTQALPASTHPVTGFNPQAGDSQQTEKVAPSVTSAPTPMPPVQAAPRAEPVTGPLTSTGEPMIAGRQYHVGMPDGRNILVNYKGWVPHAFNLPRQHGINNAAYTEVATGHTWVWTVPATGPNVPQWLDP